MPLRRYALVSLALLTACTGVGTKSPPACNALTYADAPYIVCTFDTATTDIRLFLDDENGAPYGQFDTLNTALEEDGKTLLFAMNAGMYHADRSPVGLYIENGIELQSANTNDGPGNFHLKPNGVFYLGAGEAGVMETEAFLASDLKPEYATQSGPMLVVDGAIHPVFNPDSTSRKRRNGVGVSEDGRRIIFAISDIPVTFHAFATIFRDELQTKNALFLDGNVSKIYTIDEARNEQGLDMGPIVAVME